MKNIKKILILFLVCALTVVCLAACSKNDDESSDDDKPAKSTQSSTTPEAVPTADSEPTAATPTAEQQAEPTAAQTEPAAKISGIFVPYLITMEDGTQIEYEKYIEDSLAESGIQPGTEDYEQALELSAVSYEFLENGTLKVTVLGVSAEAQYTFDGTKGTISMEGEQVSTFVYDSAAKTITETDETGSSTVFKLKD